MTANRRIVLNIIATYGRSLYALVIGLFCGRWTLMALGEVDYGLMGVVGGLTAFITYLNGMLSGAIGRFFAISIGEQQLDRENGLANSRMWFTTAVVIQTIMPTILLIACYPAGEWTVRNFLTIPVDRINACIWVWRFVCASCYLGMVTMPWNAMYGAHQYIAELTVYSFATTTLNACFLYYMVTHPAVWLARFAFLQCLLAILPNIMIATRAYFIFPECRIVRCHLRCWQNIKKMASFSLWDAWGMLGVVFRAQGIAILVNKYFGPKANASVSVGTSLSAHCNTLEGSMLGAFSPAIFNAWGAKQYDVARAMAFRVCKMGTLCILIFSIPLSLEVREVLRLWLKNPPQYAAGICLFIMAMTVIDKMAFGHIICVKANGKIALYQLFVGTSLVMTLPLAWFLIELECGMVCAIGWAMVIAITGCVIGRVVLARKLVGMSARYWIRRVFVPLVCTIIMALGLGSMPQLFMAPSFLRICVTTAIVEIVLVPFSWFIVLDYGEREYIRSRVCSFCSSFIKSDR